MVILYIIIGLEFITIFYLLFNIAFLNRKYQDLSNSLIELAQFISSHNRNINKLSTDIQKNFKKIKNIENELIKIKTETGRI